MTSQTSTARAAVRKNRTSEVAVVPLPEEALVFYDVSYSSRLRRDCTPKCRLAKNALLELVGGFPALLFTYFRPHLGRHLNIALEQAVVSCFSKCMPSSRSTGKGRLFALSMAGGSEESRVPFNPCGSSSFGNVGAKVTHELGKLGQQSSRT